MMAARDDDSALGSAAIGAPSEKFGWNRTFGKIEIKRRHQINGKGI